MEFSDRKTFKLFFWYIWNEWIRFLPSEKVITLTFLTGILWKYFYQVEKNKFEKHFSLFWAGFFSNTLSLNLYWWKWHKKYDETGFSALSFSTFPSIYQYRVYPNTWDCLNMLLLFNLLYVIIDLTIVSSMGNRTSTCLMYDSCDDKNNNRFIELCF